MLRVLVGGMPVGMWLVAVRMALPAMIMLFMLVRVAMRFAMAVCLVRTRLLVRGFRVLVSVVAMFVLMRLFMSRQGFVMRFAVR